MRITRILKIAGVTLCAALIAAAPNSRDFAGSATRHPAPRTLSASLTGIFYVQRSQTCEWDGGGEGGVQPYTYKWTINSSQFGYVDPFAGYTEVPDVMDYFVSENNGAYFDITFEVWDANGSHASITKRVNVAYGGYGCVA